VRDRQIEVVDRQVQETRVDRLEGAEARVHDVVRRKPVDRQVHRLDGERELVGADRERGLVDLDDPGARVEKCLDLLPDLTCQRWNKAHLANMLKRSYTHIGAGYATGPQGYHRYYVQVFGTLGARR